MPRIVPPQGIDAHSRYYHVRLKGISNAQIQTDVSRRRFFAVWVVAGQADSPGCPTNFMFPNASRDQNFPRTSTTQRRTTASSSCPVPCRRPRRRPQRAAAGHLARRELLLVTSPTPSPAAAGHLTHAVAHRELLLVASPPGTFLAPICFGFGSILGGFVV
jgi:hypothetical protein